MERFEGASVLEEDPQEPQEPETIADEVIEAPKRKKRIPIAEQTKVAYDAIKEQKNIYNIIGDIKRDRDIGIEGKDKELEMAEQRIDELDKIIEGVSDKAITNAQKELDTERVKTQHKEKKFKAHDKRSVPGKTTVGLPGDAKARVGAAREVLADENVLSYEMKEKERGYALEQNEHNTINRIDEAFQNLKKWRADAIARADRVEKTIKSVEQKKQTKQNNLKHDQGIHEIERKRDAEYEEAAENADYKDEKVYFAEQRRKKIKEEIEIDSDITTPVERTEPTLASVPQVEALAETTQASETFEQLPGKEELQAVFEQANESEEFRNEIAEELPYTPVAETQQIEPVINSFAVGLSTPEDLKEMIKDETDLTLLKQNRETRQTAYDELVGMTADAREQGNTVSLKKLIEYTNQQQRAIQIIDERIAALGLRLGDKTEIVENRFGNFIRRVFGLPRIWKKRD
ncbi:MAG: hypothetical protein M3Q73_02235 [bacterium]|nr:hypothetical protein [bacterium]